MTQRYNCQEKLDASHSLGWKGWLTHSRDKAYCNLLMWDQWLTTRHFTGLSIHDLTPTTIPRQPCPAVNSYISIFHFVPFSPFFPFISFPFFPFVSLNPSLSYVLSFFHFLSPLFNLLFSLFFFFLYFYLIFSFLFLFVFFHFLFHFYFSFSFSFSLLLSIFFFSFYFFFVFLFFVCLHLFCFVLPVIFTITYNLWSTYQV